MAFFLPSPLRAKPLNHLDSRVLFSSFDRELHAVCKRRGFPLERLGMIGPKKLPLSVIRLGSPSGQPVALCAGMHGDEQSGPLAVLHFLRTASAKEWAGLRLTIFPLANPTGFARCKRRCIHNRDLNRHFRDDILVDENRLLYRALRQKPKAFLTIHEDEHMPPSAYCYAFRPEESPLPRQIIAAAAKHLPICRNRVLHGDSMERGVIGFYGRTDGSFEDRLAEDGVKHCITTEVSAYAPLEKRLAANLAMVRAFLKFSRDL